MTPGERVLWAAAFVDAYSRRMGQVARLDSTGTPQFNPRLGSHVPHMAVMDAAAIVRIARDALPKMLAAEVKPNHKQSVDDAIAMLRDMLGVGADGSPYR